MEQMTAIAQCCRTLEVAFSDVQLEHGPQQLSAASDATYDSLLRHIRSRNDNFIHYFLPKLMCHFIAGNRTYPEKLDELIEFLDADQEGSATQEEIKDAFGEVASDELERKRENNVRLREPLWRSFTKGQSFAIVSWLELVAARGLHSPWRKRQLTAAIRYWKKRASESG